MCSSPVPVAFVITLLLPKPVLSGIKELLFLCSIHKCICKDNKYVVQSHSSDFFGGGLVWMLLVAYLQLSGLRLG